MNISSKTRLKPDSKKEYETFIDTVIIEKPLPEIRVSLSRLEKLLDKTITNNNGFYIFPDTLKSGKEYSLLALKPEIKPEDKKEPEPEPEPEIVQPDTIVPVVQDTIKKEEKPIDLIQPAIDTIVTKPVEVPVKKDTIKVIQPVVLVAPKKDTVVQVVVPVIVEKPVVNIFEIRGTILDSISKKVITGCDIELYEGGKFKEKVVSNSKGEVVMKVTEGQVYELYINKEGFFQSVIPINSNIKQGSAADKLSILMKPIEKNKAVEVKKIHFELNKYTLTKDSYSVLDQLVEFLTLNKGVTIELNAHTDTRGDYYPNLILSYKRAETVREYLASKGVEDSRIFANGFGETFPLIKDAKLEKDHEKNRRVELKVIDNNGQNVSQTGFSVLSINPYSSENPFPLNVPVPEGQVYRINLGSFKKAVPYDTFEGIFPVVQEFDKVNQTYNYYAGLFNNQDAVENALSIVKKTVSVDATTQAYFDKVPVSNEELKRRMDASSGFKDGGDEKDAVLPVYSIQIGAFKSAVSTSIKADFREIAGSYKLFVNEYKGFTIYSIGNFKTYALAFDAKQELIGRGLANDCFVIALLNGQKIPVNEANEIIERNKR
jgi:outer membrane protein OmpA-like peptidoglycan-associated protein